MLVVVLATALALPAAAQRGSADLARAFELERAGEYDSAAVRYRDALVRNPANLSALLGLERVLVPVNRLRSIVSHVDSALVLQPDNRSIRSLDLRIWVTLEDAGRFDAAASAWIDVMPNSPEPYSEWARGLMVFGDLEGAQRVLALGVERLDDASLSKAMAELSVQAGDWLSAGRQWRVAARRNGSFISAATASLAAAPMEMRDRVVEVLTEDRTDETGGRMAADLLVGWGRAVEAWAALDRVLPAERQTAVALLRRFADRTRLIRDANAARARGFALERMAQLSDAPAAERARIEAARAFVDAGDSVSAERIMSQIAVDAESGQRTATAAVATLIGVMAESGRMDEAEGRFREWVDRLSGDEVVDLRDRIVRGWIRVGNLDRAEMMLGPDSSVSTAAVRGWVALYRGDLRTAMELFRQAGPRQGTRREATQRTGVLALVQRIGPDTVPAFGAALLMLTRGDSMMAVEALEGVARELPDDDGAPDVFGYAGRIAVELERPDLAEPLLKAVLRLDPHGIAAPQAEYHLARSYQLGGDNESAMQQLEHLILEFPDSALLPMARRLFDKLRGAIPSRAEDGR